MDQENFQEILLVVCLVNWWIILKALGSLATCLEVNKNLWGKLVSSLEIPIIFDDNLNTASV